MLTKSLTFLVLGITGDLARKKIIPAISQLSSLYPEVPMKLIGYSRSTADREGISQILNQFKHQLALELHTGSYDDVNLLSDLIGRVSQHEKMIIYLAIPPVAFVPFLETTCPLDPSNIDIIIEKPFGRDQLEAQTIIAKSQSCTLTNRIFFFDHYLFKSGTILPDTLLPELQNLTLNFDSITIEALEKLGVGGRLGYYNDTGAIQDMWQHLHSLWYLYGQVFQVSTELQNLQLTGIGQYESYNRDLFLENSITESYFEVQAMMNSTQVTFKSGKKTGLKQTRITAQSEAKDYSLEWFIDPKKYLTINQGNRNMLTFEFPNSDLFDHTRLFIDLMQNHYDRFVKAQEIMESWQTYHQISSQKNNRKLVLYPDNTIPIF